MSSEVYEVIVVGCGAAGLAALSRLSAAGKKVLALEARADIGGRVRTVNFGDGIVELGAEWIHGEEGNRVFELATKRKVDIKKQCIDMEVWNSAGRPEGPRAQELLMYCWALMEEAPDSSQTLGEYVTTKFYEYVERYPDLASDTGFCTNMLSIANLVSNNYNATNDWTDISLIGSNSYEECPGHQHWSWHRRGYNTLLDMLMVDIRANGNAEIQMRKEVTLIQWCRDDGRVLVQCQDGSTHTALSAIVTCSLGVLKERHLGMFSPPLPGDKAEAIDKMSFGVMDKICLQFGARWWPESATFFALLWLEEHRAALPESDRWITQIFGFSTPLGCSDAVTLWTSGDVAKRVEVMPEEEVLAGCLRLLRTFMGETVPPALRMIRSQWHSEREFRGSYSYRGLACDRSPRLCDALAGPLRAGPRRRIALQLAGEATHPTKYSTVHGALDTGYAAADRILQQAVQSKV